MNTVNLTAREREQAREKAVKAIRGRLQERKPDAKQYDTESSRAARIIAATLIWSKAAVPLIALLAALASSVRTVQTASEIYTASGSHPIGVAVAAVAFTISVEFALFVLALAQEGARMKWRAEGRTRNVASIKTLWHGVLVRMGSREPLRHDQLAERDNLRAVMLIALSFAIAANAYIGLRPIIEQIGAASLQDFAGSIWTASAALQMTFIVDFVAVLFPPLMAVAAGHLTARFAVEIAESSAAGRRAYESDLDKWRAAFAQPLNTDEGRELLNEYLEDAQKTKINRQQRRKARQAAETAETPALEYIEGDESEETAESRPFVSNGHTS